MKKLFQILNMVAIIFGYCGIALIVATLLKNYEIFPSFWY